MPSCPQATFGLPRSPIVAIDLPFRHHRGELIRIIPPLRQYVHSRFEKQEAVLNVHKGSVQPDWVVEEVGGVSVGSLTT